MNSDDAGGGNVSAILVMNQTTNATSSLNSSTESTTVVKLEMRGWILLNLILFIFIQ
jgi:hypothetical protein